MDGAFAGTDPWRYLHQVKYLISVAVVSVFLLSSCAGQPQVTDRTRVISIGYHSEQCVECKELQAKMRRMNVRFALAPIVFIKYDKTTPETRAASEDRLEAVGMLDVAHRDDSLRKVILYDAQTRETIATINASDPVPVIREKISAALGG